MDITHIQGNVEARHVAFGYNSDRLIIHDFSGVVKAGQKVAIVGPTGAGKTTMIKLLMRFYDVNSGEILIDGHNVKDFNRSRLREMFGMVLQGLPGCSMEPLWKISVMEGWMQQIRRL